MSKSIWQCAGFCAIVLATWVAPQSARAQFTVHSGYDLFSAVDATINGNSFVGLPIGSYNFGDGSVRIGNTDTIVQRLSDVTVSGVGGTGTTNLLLPAVQLVSASAINGHYEYFTLDPSQRSTGTMTINFGSPSGGTFNSFFDVFFDIHVDSLTGTVIQNGELQLSGSNALWGRTPPSGAVQIPGVNTMLNGQDTSTDFWPTVGNASTPEPATTCLALAGVALAMRRRRSRRS